MKKIIICLYLLSFNFLLVQAQNVIQLSDASGIALQEDEVASLEIFASNSLPAFSEENFKIIDASFYTFNDEMGEDRENAIWEDFKAEAKSKSPNYLLLGRQYFEDKGGFKLWVHLEVDIEDLECYDANFKSEITAYISNSQQELVEWYEYLSFTPESNGFEIVEQVAELGYFKLEKVCCEIDATRSSCDPDKLNPKELADERNLKYYILGKIKCELFGASSSCNSYPLDNEEPLATINNEDLKEGPGAIFYLDDDTFTDIGYLHIYLSDNPDLMINCGIQPNYDVRQKYNGSAFIQDVDVSVYDVGRFTIVLEKGKDLYQILSNINVNVDNNLSEIVTSISNGTTISDSQFEILNYSSDCNFTKLSELNKYALMKAIVTEGTYEWYKFYRWFSEKYPLFIRQLYDAIGEIDASGYLNKKDFFNYQNQNVEFAFNLLEYDFPAEIKQSFYKDYISDYLKSHVTISDGSPFVTVNGVPQSEILHLSYEVNKFLNFYNTNYEFDLLKDEGKVKIRTIDGYSIGGGIWVDHALLNPFDPVYMPKIDIKEFSAVAGVLPAIILTNVDKYIGDENAFNGFMLAVDVVSTLSVVGNIGKLRHLGKIKLFFTGVEISATLGNNLIKYTELIEDEALRNRVSMFLSVIEVLSAVGNGLSPSDIKNIQDEGSDIAKLLDEEPSVDPKLAAGLRLISGGKANLLSRIENIFGPTTYSTKDLYKFVNGLDEVNDANKISRLSALDEHALIQVSNQVTETAKITKFADDLVDPNKGLGLVLYFNSSFSGVNAWKICLLDNLVRTNPGKLNKVARYLDNNPSKGPAFKIEFDALSSSKRGLFVDRTSKLDDINVAHGPFNWGNFNTSGFNPANAPQSLKQKIFDALVYPPGVQAKWNKVDEFIKSGGTPNSGLAKEIDLPIGTELVKITPHIPNNPNLGASAYWMTTDAFNIAKSHPTLDIEDFLGLPAQSHAIKYDVISVTTVANTKVYKSSIASTTQGTFSRVGGGEQMIIPNVNSPAFGPRSIFEDFLGWMPE